MNAQDEMQLRSESSRGQRAVELMEDELIVEAFSILEQRFMTEWAASPARDTEGRERIWVMQKLLGNLKAHLLEVATTGKLASLQLEQNRTKVQRAKEWLTEQF